MATRIKATQKAKLRELGSAYRRWLKGSDSLSKVYGRYSLEKQAAWDYCEELRWQHEGTKLRVIGHNCQIFTAGFVFDDPKSGEVMFMYITPTKEWVASLEEIWEVIE